MSLTPDAGPVDTASYAVIAVELRYIKEAVERIERTSSSYVPRPEFEQRAAYVDGQFLAHKAEMVALKAELASRRAPWWSVGSFAVAAAALLIVIVPLLSK